MFLGQKVAYYMVHIAYYTELNLQICNYAQRRCICFTHLTFVAIFTLTERLPIFADLMKEIGPHRKNTISIPQQKVIYLARVWLLKEDTRDVM